MIIDTEGGMHIIQGTTHQKWQDYLENGGTVAHTFCFGPGLVIDGVVRDEFDSRMDNGPKTLAQRMIFGQITPMEFVILAQKARKAKARNPSVLTCGARQSWRAHSACRTPTTSMAVPPAPWC